MNACEGAMTTINCADTESGAHDTANAAFDEAASQLEELGYEYEITSDGVSFSRAEPVVQCSVVDEYGPDSRTAAAAFLGFSGYLGGQ